ncbi:acyl-CoA Delta(11) desaturase isoform X2 [Nilaparvata lugens]|uniref:Desaturase 4 n=2 Tax=Nilaparvata lugens TaxID=108931 RepID=A0A4D6CBZ6_NILLU|nr:acyl-CoA Delta(11) desaturase isoform X2 [Nilaparvata lugens]QBY26789.1 desaturase 4 [Nilaparvata lugens]
MRDKSQCTNNNHQFSEVDENIGKKYVSKIRWPDLLAQLFVHGGGIFGIYLIFTSAKLLTAIWAIVLTYTSGFGITAGAHRLWSHRAYKAKWPLRLLLAFLFTISGQRHVYAWALDHRVHHKFSETDADPHDARRGFWFAHVGWLFLTPHPAVVACRKAIDMSDLENDLIVVWQRRLYIPLFGILCLGLPVFIPWYFWKETLFNAFFISFNTRFSVTLNMAFAVNSFAHMYGQKPYDKNIMPVENLLVSVGALGEGWHNFHHVFPWDYKTSELGHYSFNLTTAFIDYFRRIGWAYDCKRASAEMIRSRSQRCGDGSRPVWGYGDRDMSCSDLKLIE